MTLLIYMGILLVGAAGSFALFRKRPPRWQRLGLPDPADDGWSVNGDTIKHQSGLVIGENPGYPKEQHPFLMAGKTVLLGSAAWYARAVMTHVVGSRELRRLLAEGGDTLTASATMKVEAIEQGYKRRTLKLVGDGCYGNLPLSDEDAPLWKVGDEVFVTARRA